MEREIITGVDRSERSRAAADWAAREALSRGLPLRVVHVSLPAPPDRAERRPYRSETVADQVVAELTDRHPSLRARGLHLTGAPVAVLRTMAEDAELLVVGLRGEGSHPRIRVGTTAGALTRTCERPVVLVPGALAADGPPGRVDGVTLGIDARSPAGGAVTLAFDTAGLRGARLHAVHAWRLPAQAAERPFPALEEDRATWEDDEVQRLSDALRPWRGKYPEVDVLEDVVLLAPEVALTHAAGNSGLVVVGRHSGRTALSLLPHTGCPVAVVPV
ncbi:universal stress protein [Streptomyces sp. PAN_FS17]|uniref:universal stress protein n=1 Tax=Streptomyces sp. PAN_FS17 TaxID=1855351 RepID=UPI0008983554|nr:universal stress protein [Streptomyces sp. PAN_FS17]SEE06996.1 Nucleotide-binding universal stress protein, UspA family [Streptomyces sp. PAN_FS17]